MRKINIYILLMLPNVLYCQYYGLNPEQIKQLNIDSIAQTTIEYSGEISDTLLEVFMFNSEGKIEKTRYLSPSITIKYEYNEFGQIKRKKMFMSSGYGMATAWNETEFYPQPDSLYIKHLGRNNQPIKEEFYWRGNKSVTRSYEYNKLFIIEKTILLLGKYDSLSPQVLDSLYGSLEAHFMERRDTMAFYFINIDTLCYFDTNGKLVGVKGHFNFNIISQMDVFDFKSGIQENHYKYKFDYYFRKKNLLIF